MVERLRCAIGDRISSLRRGLQDKIQRSNAEMQGQVELSLFTVLAGINPAVLEFFPRDLFPPLEYKTTSHLLHPQDLFLARDTNTLAEVTNRLLGLVDPQKRSIIYCGALGAAADILGVQLRHDDAGPDFTKDAIHRLQFIQKELARLTPKKD